MSHVNETVLIGRHNCAFRSAQPLLFHVSCLGGIHVIHINPGSHFDFGSWTT